MSVVEQALVITVIGAAIGMALTYPAAQAVGSALSNFFPVFNVARETLWLDAGAALVVAVAAAVIPTQRAIGIRIADGLRRIG